MSSERASVCVVLHSAQNTWETARCIDALFNGTHIGPVELFVADDTEVPGRVPDHWRVTCAQKPALHRGDLCNLAAASTAAEYLAFLSADVVPPADWLIELLGRARQAAAEMVFSPIADPSGVRHCGFDVGPDGHAQPSVSRTGGHIAGPIDAMCVKRSAFVAADGFDEHYGSAYEDVDFGWRLRISGGHIVVAEAAPVTRQHAAAHALTPAARRQRERNALATLYKCSGDERLFPRLCRALTAAIARGLPASSLSTRPLFGDGASQPVDVTAACAAMLTALDDFACWLPRLANQRRRIQSRRAVSDSSIDSDLAPPMAAVDGWTGSLAALAEMAADAPADPDQVAHSVTPSPSIRDPAIDVSVIVLTASGARHLPDCLDALADLQYPRERLEILVVDNASAESPATFVASHRSHARLVQLPRNLGFCGGNTEGARHAKGEWLLFLNDDTRIASNALVELLATADRHDAACVSALIVNWDGTEVDFGGGEVNFEAKGFQLGLGDPAIHQWTVERPVLFASGAGMMVRRELYLSIGGFNESYFAYYEDVAFGWLLRILGHDVWLNGKARVHHRHHGTSGAWAPTRSRLCERNSLLTLVTHLERPTLDAALPAALLLTASRAALGAGLGADTPGASSVGFRRMWPGGGLTQMKHALARRGATRTRGVWRSLAKVGVGGLIDAVREAIGAVLTTAPVRSRVERQLAAAAADNEILMRVPPSVGAPLVALADWLERLPDQVCRRRQSQAARRRTDVSALAGFESHWTTPVPAPHQAQYNARHAAVTDAFALAWASLLSAPASRRGTQRF